MTEFMGKCASALLQTNGGKELFMMKRLPNRDTQLLSFKMQF